MTTKSARYGDSRIIDLWLQSQASPHTQSCYRRDSARLVWIGLEERGGHCEAGGGVYGKMQPPFLWFDKTACCRRLRARRPSVPTPLGWRRPDRSCLLHLLICIVLCFLLGAKRCSVQPVDHIPGAYSVLACSSLDIAIVADGSESEFLEHLRGHRVLLFHIANEHIWPNQTIEPKHNCPFQE
jgi:hypothetical protein